MFCIFLILIFIRPFISSPGFIYANAVYSSLLLLFLLAWLWRKGLPLQEIKPLKWPLLLFVAALAVSVAFSQERVHSFRELYKYISGLLIFLFCLRFSAEQKNKTIKILTASGLAIALLAIYQYLFGFAWLSGYVSAQGLNRPFIADLIARKRVFFPFVTANTLAGYLAMAVFFVIAHWDKERKWLMNPLFYILIVIFYALVLTKSIGAFSSLLLAALIYLLLKGKLKKREIVFFAVLIIVTGGIFAARASTRLEHAHPLFSTTMRLGYWKETIALIAAHPFTGVGLGNFNIPQARYAHNSYLQLWAEMGPLGIITFLWLVIAVLKSFFKKLAGSPYRHQEIAIFAAAAAFLIHNLIDFSFFLPEVSLIWWTAIGIMLARA